MDGGQLKANRYKDGRGTTAPKHLFPLPHKTPQQTNKQNKQPNTKRETGFLNIMFKAVSPSGYG